MASAILRNGSQGDEVRILQASLRSAGFLSETPDGIFGDRTEQAVRAFQQQNDLSEDGEVGEKTWAKLNEVESVGC